MTYVVLARKWRPQRFDDVLGQDHVTRTLMNAIRARRVAHAFLLSGPRGVGKTSAARILAKALCCEREDGPTPEPCGVCRQCEQITEGRSTDVFEIDAASHTGVDNVREIIENVRYLPSSARFKIYVIDEVHMLSTGAFNALLKTLEEPPAHVKFILATTDAHKVPVTILSRCQRYDFRRIPLSRIAERLSEILTREGVDHDPSALGLIAREGDGSMRDAQSLLEQVLAFAGGRRLDGTLVREALFVVDHALVERAFAGLLGRDPGGLIELVGEAYGRGVDLKRFADALIEHARDLLVARHVRDPKAVLDRPTDEIQAMATQARAHPAATFERLFEQLCRVAEDVARSAHPRFALEVGLAALAEAPPHAPLPELVEQLGRLETMLSAQPGPPRGPGGRGPPHVAEGGGRGSAPPPAAPPSPRAEPERAPSEAPPSRAAPSLSPSDAAEPLSPRPAPGDFAELVRTVRKTRPVVAAHLHQVRPLRFLPGAVELGCETSFDQARLEEPSMRRELEQIFSGFFGVPTTLTVSSRRDTSGGERPPTLEEAAAEARSAAAREREATARRHPAVQAITEALGASIAKVRVIDEG
jgi:DNA polymerase-3 subunit gamma/tau